MDTQLLAASWVPIYFFGGYALWRYLLGYQSIFLEAKLFEDIFLCTKAIFLKAKRFKDIFSEIKLFEDIFLDIKLFEDIFLVVFLMLMHYLKCIIGKILF